MHVPPTSDSVTRLAHLFQQAECSRVQLLQSLARSLLSLQ